MPGQARNAQYVTDWLGAEKQRLGTLGINKASKDLL
jgi:hypothetical protein